jgi:hypothetical protein
MVLCLVSLEYEVSGFLREWTDLLEEGNGLFGLLECVEATSACVRNNVIRFCFTASWLAALLGLANGD